MQKKLLVLLSVIFVCLTTFAYSALSTSLAITSEVKLRPLADIRVNGIGLNSASGGAIIQYESDYSKNTISSGFVLPNTSSSISYTVHIDNSGDVDYSIYDFLKTSSNNPGLVATISGYNMRDIIPAKTSLDLVVTYTTTTPGDGVINVVNTFDFRKVFRINYNTGTTQSIPQQIKYERVDLALSSTVPTKNGYTFSKWNTKSDGTGVNYNSGATYTVDEDKTLYARWNITTYNITYNLDGGTNGNNPSTYTIETNNITLADAAKENYVFKGWIGNGTTTPTKNLVLPKGSTGNKEYTAVFKDETNPTIEVTSIDESINYLTTAHSIDAIYNSSTADISFKINANDIASGINKIEFAITTSSTVPTSGWTETSSRNVAQTMDRGNYYIHVRATDAENNQTVVTTKLITIRFKVTYYDDYSTSTTVSANQYYTGSSLTSRTPTAKEGYTFDGWYSEPELTNKVVNGNASYTPTKSIRLYGKWNINTYTIGYTLNGGTVSGTNPTSYNVESSAITLINPTKTGYTFKGWSGTELTGDTNQAVTIATGSTGNRSYTANWTANQYTVTANANGGSIPATTGWTGTGNTATKPVTYGSTYGTLPTPTKTGYTFKGWNGKNLLDFSKCSFVNATLNNDNSVTSNVNNHYYSYMRCDYLKDYLLDNLGEKFTFSMNEGISGKIMSIVVYGTRTGGATHQEAGSVSGERKVSMTLANDFTNITAVELRFNRIGSRFTDTVTRTDFQFEKNSSATPYEPYYITSDTIVTTAGDHDIHAIWKDETAPTNVNITSTNSVASSQTATLTCSDGVGVTSYYWGTTAPTDSSTYTDITSTTSMSINKTVNASGTYYLVCKDAAGNKSDTVSKVFYKTTLNMTNGTVTPASVITMTGNSFNLPTPTATTGYTAKGLWYTNSGMTTGAKAYGASYTPSSNATLYSGAIINKYNVEVVVNHGTGSNAKEVNYGSTETFAVGADTGYENPTVSCTNSQTATISGTTLTTGTITNNTVCTVTYVAKTYTLTINPQGGTYNSTTLNSTKTMTFDASINNDIGIPTRSGYTFAGWYTQANGGTQLYGTNGRNVAANGYWSGAYSSGVWKKDADVTVYAKWTKAVTATTNTLSETNFVYNGNAQGPTVTVKDGNTTLTSGTDYTVSGNSNTDVGEYTITITGKGVYNSTTKSYYNGTTTLTYYINNAKITYDANSCGTISGTNPAYVKKNATGVYTTIRGTTAGTIASISKSGYTFNGWYDGNTKVINANGTVVASVSNWTDSNNKWLITEDKTLTASCSRDSYSINYAMNNGINNSNNPSSYNIESSAITLVAPTKTLTFKGNYNATSGANASSTSGVSLGSDTTKAQTFAGWTGSNGTTAQTNVTIPTGSTGNKNYTAHWTAVAGTLPTVTRTGYTCGWNTSNSGTTIEYASGATFPTSAITEGMSATVNLYAVCIPNTYTVRYCQGNNSTTAGYTCSSTTSTHMENVSKNLTSYSSLGLTEPTGWTFAGWNTSASGLEDTYTDGASVVNLSQTPNSTVNLYAVFKRNIKIYSGIPNSYTEKTQYYNPYTTTNVSSILLDVTSTINNWTSLGFRDDTTAGIAEYLKNATVSPPSDEDVSYYEVYSRNLVIHYNGNGNISGTTADTTKTIYLNSNSTTTSSQQVTLANSGFEKPGYSFSKWTLGSTSGTSYNANASYNPNFAYNASSFEATMYAKWLGMYHNIVWDNNYQNSSLVTYSSPSDFIVANSNTTMGSYGSEPQAKYGLQLSFNGVANTVPSIRTRQAYSLTAGKTYTVSFFARSNLNQTMSAYLSSATTSSGTYMTCSISKDYKKCTLTFNVETSGNYYLGLQGDMLSQNASIYFHSLELTQVSATNGLIYDISNKKMTFDGVDDWWNLGQRNSAAQTLDATFKTQTGTAPTDQYILGNWENGGGGIFISPSGYLCGNYYLTEYSDYKAVCTTYKAQANTEYHLGLTYDGSVMKLYVNGELAKELTVTGTIGTPQNNTIMSLGSNPSGTNGGGSYFKGTIKSARVYNQAKSADDMRRHYLFDQGDDVDGCIAASGLVYNIGRYNTNIGIGQTIWSRRGNEAIGSVPSVSRSGYTFDGWWTDPVGGTRVTAETIMGDSNMIVYAHWKYNVTVTFNPTGGTVSPTTKTVAMDSPYGELPIPTKTGYYFAGWSNGILPYEYQQIEYITGDGSHYIDTGYYAKPNTYVSADFQFTNVSTLQQRLFGGNGNNLWYELYINGNGKWAYAYNDNSGNWIPTTVTADTSRHTLDFNILESGVRRVEIDVSTYNQPISGTATKTSTTSMKILATAGGSYIAKARIYSFKIYEDNVIIHNFVPAKRVSDNVQGLYDIVQQKFHTLNHTIEDPNLNMVDSTKTVSNYINHTLYAKWSKTQTGHTANYNCTQHGGTEGSGIYTETLNYGDAIDLTKSCNPPSGYTQIGWNTQSGATTALSSLNMGSADVTLYAIYRSNTQHTGTFIVQDSAAVSAPADTTTTLSCYSYNNNSYCEITTPKLTARSGYTAYGWTIDGTPSSTTADFASDTQISIDTNHTFKSVTKQNAAVTITFNRNTANSHATSLTPSGGSATTATTVTATCTRWNGANCSITSPTMTTATGHRTIGFNTNATVKVSTWDAGTVKAVGSGTTYYAITDVNAYTVVYNMNCPSGSTGSGTTENSRFVYDGTYDLNSNGYSCSGYIFDSWNSKADGSGTRYLENQAVQGLNSEDNGTFNLYAQWKEVWAENLSFDNTTARTKDSTITCIETQCMIDKLWERFNSIYHR